MLLSTTSVYTISSKSSDMYSYITSGLYNATTTSPAFHTTGTIWYIVPIYMRVNLMTDIL